MYKNILRTPIIIQRQSVKLSMVMKCQLRLQEFIKETQVDDATDIMVYYERLVFKHTGTFYTSLPESNAHVTERNRTAFLSVREICRMKQWDWRLYLECQVDRYGKKAFPRPHQLYSKTALIAFTNYLSTIKQKYKGTLNADKKEKGKEILDIRTEIVEEVISSIETLSFYIPKEGSTEQREQAKMLRLYHSWEEYSPYYLWSIPWFNEVLNELATTKNVEECRRIFRIISSNNSFKDLVITTTKQAEEYFKVPDNLRL